MSNKHVTNSRKAERATSGPGASSFPTTAALRQVNTTGSHAFASAAKLHRAVLRVGLRAHPHRRPESFPTAPRAPPPGLTW